ncbi:hypothetical protein EVAR_31947_1 [Eumeta japonica]|uniref:Uncharacterized protein n=1 Tax=Eumeta variegata TaxID=151549 RepID=A0A4C1WQ29_EUMVA|nr:hypothetical protein EVAR_31947_1 [Eumeta japonica]
MPDEERIRPMKRGSVGLLFWRKLPDFSLTGRNPTAKSAILRRSPLYRRSRWSILCFSQYIVYSTDDSLQTGGTRKVLSTLELCISSHGPKRNSSKHELPIFKAPGQQLCGCHPRFLHNAMSALENDNGTDRDAARQSVALQCVTNVRKDAHDLISRHRASTKPAEFQSD